MLTTHKPDYNSEWSLKANFLAASDCLIISDLKTCSPLRSLCNGKFRNKSLD